ncbi:aldo/keto reductase [Streptomyces mirabilis]|uniref:aldo/keto reductase n=1 Tax=Streptomyces mirabilis TaxID=68239 RepID=UPI00365E6EEC
MGMSEGYGPTSWDDAIDTIRRALDLGVTLIDTADAYAFGHNEVLVGQAGWPRRRWAGVTERCGEAVALRRGTTAPAPAHRGRGMAIT